MNRYLEIGPGKTRVEGFETFNLGANERSDGGLPDHVGDARDLSLFSDQTFDVVYSSHCIEHVHWYELKDTIKEWSRILKYNGTLEVWTVNGYEIMKELLLLEDTSKCSKKLKARWQIEKTKGDPYLWLTGRLLSYPRDNSLDFDHNLHRSIITPKLLIECFEEAGLKDVRLLKENENRIVNKHGWINMGVIGKKC
jgi:predicted SAM-dependent methyltransferase